MASVVVAEHAGMTTRVSRFVVAKHASGMTREVDRLIKAGYTHVVDADLAADFDSIPHDRLMARVEEKVSDGRALDLIRGWLKADILKGLERWTPMMGSPRRGGARLRHDVR